MSKKIYCGNNAKDRDLVSGKAKLGTRYQCLHKGIGRGLHMPVTNTEYEPIDNRRIYCGNQAELPDGYDSIGNLPQCLQKGVGVGKRLRIEKESKIETMSKLFIPLFILYQGTKTS